MPRASLHRAVRIGKIGVFLSPASEGGQLDFEPHQFGIWALLPEQSILGKGERSMAGVVREVFELVRNLGFVEAKVEGHFSS